MAKAHLLIDNFNDDQVDTALWAVSPSGSDAIREVNGRVEIRPAGNAAGTYAYVSATTWDLTESWAMVRLVSPLRPLPSTSSYLIVAQDGSNYATIAVANGYVIAGWAVAGSFANLRLVTYDPAAHRWLRISESGGTTYWEVSADGVSFTTVYRAADAFSLTAVAAIFGATVYVASYPAPGLAVFDSFNAPETGIDRRVEERRRSARGVRVQAADLAAGRTHDEHANNNDEVNYPSQPLVGSYSKGLKHDALGDPDPASYATLLRALESREPRDFEEIQLGASPGMKLTNPQSGLAFDLEGPDAQAYTIPPAPRLDSAQAAHEAGELYWMGLARDVAFIDYASDTTIADAVSSLNNEFPQFGGTVPVTAQNVFRGIYPGEQVGPYVSQFLLKGNDDPRKLDGEGKDAEEGFISYGARVIDQRFRPAAPGSNFIAQFSTWLAVQNGSLDRRGLDSFDTVKRFIRDLRGGTTLVHFDQVLDTYYNTAWILMTEPVGNQLNSVTGRPQIDLEFPKDQGNPYDPPGTAMDSKTQAGFNTFGPTHLLQTLGEVLGRALRAVWFQKWFVHRRLRPEEYGGRVHNHVTGARTYPLHASITTSLTSGGLAPYVGQTGERWPQGYLLQQAYPEGAPTHPAYGAGHATGSGALVTILKAFFDESTPIENPVQASADGLSLVAYTGADAGQMTVGGELNKLAGNIALFRNAAGVHWRSDYTESLPLGEAIAIGLLQEMSLGFNEDDAYFQLTKFDGTTIRIFDGKVVPVS